MTNPPMIQVRNMTARYGSETVFDNISFDVYSGEIFVILGGSGCGKSTLLKHLIGLYRPAEGRILIDGDDISTAQGEDLQKIQRKFGILFQSGALFGSMTLAQNVALPLQEYTSLPPKAIDELVRMKLAMVQLAGYENHLPAEISGGMKKRAGLARAMALDPKILFFDEPSAGLDPITSADLDSLILQLNRSLGTTIVIVTHELASIYAVAKRVIMLDKQAKKIIAQGDPHELKSSSSLPKVRNFFNRQGETAAV
jgi:phospholipid/cholesterol/gamma-HCH transport system ATP-binding protein